MHAAIVETPKPAEKQNEKCTPAGSLPIYAGAGQSFSRQPLAPCLYPLLCKQTLKPIEETFKPAFKRVEKSLSFLRIGEAGNRIHHLVGFIFDIGCDRVPVNIQSPHLVKQGNQFSVGFIR